MEFKEVVMKIMGGKNLDLSLIFISSQVLIFLLPFLTVLTTTFDHQIEAYFLSFKATSFTFLSSGMS